MAAEGWPKASAFVNWKVRRKSAAIVCGGKTRRTHNVTTRLLSFLSKPPCGTVASALTHTSRWTAQGMGYERVCTTRKTFKKSRKNSGNQKKIIFIIKDMLLIELSARFKDSL